MKLAAGRIRRFARPISQRWLKCIGVVGALLLCANVMDNHPLSIGIAVPAVPRELVANAALLVNATQDFCLLDARDIKSTTSILNSDQLEDFSPDYTPDFAIPTDTPILPRISPFQVRMDCLALRSLALAFAPDLPPPKV
jgi:hypothetical protein